MNNPLILSIILSAIAMAGWSIFVGYQIAKQKFKPKRNSLGQFSPK
jgi:hypothetical protein